MPWADYLWTWYTFYGRKGQFSYKDFSVPIRLYTDASNIGLGAILAQKPEGKKRIICCASRTLNKSEQN